MALRNAFSLDPDFLKSKCFHSRTNSFGSGFIRPNNLSCASGFRNRNDCVIQGIIRRMGGGRRTQARLPIFLHLRIPMHLHDSPVDAHRFGERQASRPVRPAPEDRCG